MSDRHEADLAEDLGGRMTRGSGNQFRDQTDGKHGYRSSRFTFAWDGKSTLGKSISITREMWQKLVEQAGTYRPLLPMRWYRSERLQVDIDLVALLKTDFEELLEAAQTADAALEFLSDVHAGVVEYADQDALLAALVDVLQGKEPYQRRSA